MTSTCPACGATGSGNFCSTCGASLGSLTCAACRAELSPQARFCHHCGHPVPARGGAPAERKAWLIAASLCLLLVGAIAYKVTSAAPGPAAPDMANAGTSTGTPSGMAPDISQMTPRERFDRLFNRIMLASEQRDAAEVQRFTPMALGAYSQLDTFDADARYHAAVLRVQVGDLAGARALADTILAESPGHLFGYMVRGTVAKLQGSRSGLRTAQREFLNHYDVEMQGNRVEYLDHRSVIEEFKVEAERGRT